MDPHRFRWPARKHAVRLVRVPCIGGADLQMIRLVSLHLKHVVLVRLQRNVDPQVLEDRFVAMPSLLFLISLVICIDILPGNNPYTTSYQWSGEAINQRAEVSA